MFTVHIHTRFDQVLGLRIPATENAYAAVAGFQELGCDVRFFDTLPELQAQLGPGDIVVGYIRDAKYAFAQLGLPPPPTLDYPAELAAFYGRRIWPTVLSQVANQPDTWPVFVKSTAQKGFTGRVVCTAHDLQDTAFQNYDQPVSCSEVVAFEAEWRGFVRHGQLYDLRGYCGRWDLFPDPAVVRAALAAWTTKPARRSIDFGVTADGRTLVVECNDGFALGHYGLNALRYAKLISARWHELMGQPDPYQFTR
ncbi:ATP-grasp domain-containing protein [Hymenobacter arcticus]